MSAKGICTAWADKNETKKKTTTKHLFGQIPPMVPMELCCQHIATPTSFALCWECTRVQQVGDMSVTSSKADARSYAFSVTLSVNKFGQKRSSILRNILFHNDTLTCQTWSQADQQFQRYEMHNHSFDDLNSVTTLTFKGFHITGTTIPSLVGSAVSTEI